MAEYFVINPYVVPYSVPERTVGFSSPPIPESERGFTGMAATDFKDFYAILGLSKSASADEIKKNYRRLARKYHPDMNPGDRAAEARFKEINEAYEVLSDSSKRKKYDQFGQYWQQADRMGNAPWGGGRAGGAGFDDFEFGRYSSFDDFINELLGRFGGPNGASSGPRTSYNYRTPPGASAGGSGFNGFSGFDGNFGGAAGNGAGTSSDREATLTLSFSEAFNGTQKRLSVGGSTITVRIPPGAKPGSKIRLRGKGQYDTYSGKRGDLYLKVSLSAHDFFEFDGDNLVCEVAIAPDEAVLGAKIEVPTPDGTVTVNVPAGVKSGQCLRLRGKGWVKSGGERSDQVVRLQIMCPKTISDAERAAYEKVRDARNYDPRQALKSVKL